MSIYDLTVKNIEGKEFSMSQYKRELKGTNIGTNHYSSKNKN